MIEREIKLAAEVGIILADLAEVAPGLTLGPRSVVQLEAVYYDTPTLALARSCDRLANSSMSARLTPSSWTTFSAV